MAAFLSAEGLAKVLQKVKAVFATKSELAVLGEDLTAQANELGATFVHKTGNETVAGTKTFSSTISGTADKALKDGSGNTITSTYVALSGNQTIAGTKTFSSTISGTIDKALKDGSGNTITSTYVALTGDQTVAGRKTFSTELTVNKNDTPAAGALSHVLRVDFKNTAGGITHTTYPVSIIGNSNTSNAYNSGVRLGSVNGTTFLTSGESGATIIAKLGFYDNENCYITSDNEIHMYVKCANDSASFAGPITFSGTAKSGGTSSTTSVKATTFIGTVSSSSDRRLKQDIGDIPDSVLDAWESSVRWKQFRMKYEGDDGPLHSGLIAQEVGEALDPSRYAAAQNAESENFDDGREWRVCYAEALAIEAACLRRRCQKLEERIAALEAKGE